VSADRLAARQQVHNNVTVRILLGLDRLEIEGLLSLDFFRQFRQI
jgi:hypothetical protein